MPPPPLRARLAHMLDAMVQIETHTAGLDFEEFAKDRFRQLGIERCLEIVSEASRHVPDGIKARYTHIPWRQVGDIGNRLRHAYHAVDSAIVWEIVNGELLELRRFVNELIQEPDRNS